MRTLSSFACKSKVWLVLGAAGVLGPAGLMVLEAGPADSSPAAPWVVPARAVRKENPLAADSKSQAAGRELFIAACLPCHGPSGKGDGPAAAALERDGKPVRPGNLSDSKMRQETDGALFWKISEGRSPMPVFQEALTEEQRWQIVTYVRTLAPPSGTDKSPTPSEKKP
jgi:mono/diheme cytochrome c family protein